MIGVDVGGTFTDVVCVRDGVIRTAKVPTAGLEGCESVLEGAAIVGVEGSKIFNHASTHGLNSIITRRLPKVAFLTTLGHRDVLDHGRIWRPRQAGTDPSWRRQFSDVARPLVPRYLRRGVEERMSAGGETLIPVNDDQVRHELAVLKRSGVEGVAICLLHSYANRSHEERIRQLVTEELGTSMPCSISSEVSCLAKEYPRASTVVIDVIMKLIYGEYTERLTQGLESLGFEGLLNYADSAANLITADFAMQQPFRIVFAGPAAGTAASEHFGAQIGDTNLLCADVGGTSCDISLVTEGRAYRNITFELEHDMVVNSLSTDIATLGAGGGSIVKVNSLGEIEVGPQSAGAQPGPACYGRGGTSPTLTDACLLMGFLDPEEFVGGSIHLDMDLAQKAFDSLDVSLGTEQRVRMAWEIGLNNVVEGIYNVGLRHGVDPRDYSLLAYGAAGPMLLPSLLGRSEFRRIIIPPLPGLFSALGLLSTDLVYSDSRSLYRVLDPASPQQVESAFDALESVLLKRIEVSEEGVQIRRSFDGRLRGQSWETPFIDAPAGPVGDAEIRQMIDDFHKEYALRNGNAFRSIPVEAVTLRVQIVVPSEKLRFTQVPERHDDPLAASGETTLRFVYEQPRRALVYRRDDLRAGDRLEGPAIVREQMATTVVPLEAHVEVGALGELYVS
ncbi:MAG: hydantoinase/oxoprolinase family protein [Acidimicrobiales bacterium]